MRNSKQPVLPNPFAETLCVPFWVFVPCILVFRLVSRRLLLCFCAENACDRRLRQRKLEKELRTGANSRNFGRWLQCRSGNDAVQRLTGQQFHQIDAVFQPLMAEKMAEVRCELTADFIEIIKDSLKITANDDVISVLLSFMDFEPEALGRMNKEYERGVNKQTDAAVYEVDAECRLWIFSSFYNLASVLLTFCGFIAVFAKTDGFVQRKDASGWTNYQAFFVALCLYTPGFPVGGFLWQVYVHLTDEKLLDAVDSESYSLLQFRLFVYCIVHFIPFFTHYIPAVVVFAPIVLVPLLIVLIIVAAQGFLPQCFFKFVNSASSLPFAAAIADILFTVCFVSIVAFYVGHSWPTSLTFALRGEYCEDSWIVFNVSRFSWKEISLIVAWMFA